MKPIDNRPRVNGLPVVSKRRWAEGERGGLRPISKKRSKALRNKAMDLPNHERQCELTPLLKGVSAWIKFSDAYKHPIDRWRWQEIDRHHVWANRTKCDEPWNIVFACRPAHDFVHRCWGQAGQVVSMVVLHRAGRLEPKAFAEHEIKPDPFWEVETWLEKERLFDREPLLKLYAIELLDYYGRSA